MNSHSHPPSPARRLLAAWLALCVFAIAALTVSPALHAWIHGEDHQDHAHGAGTDDHAAETEAGHTCAVTLFAAGVEASPTAFPITANGNFERAASQVADQSEPAGNPPHRLPPACGPPVAA